MYTYGYFCPSSPSFNPGMRGRDNQRSKRKQQLPKQVPFLNQGAKGEYLPWVSLPCQRWNPYDQPQPIVSFVYPAIAIVDRQCQPWGWTGGVPQEILKRIRAFHQPTPSPNESDEEELLFEDVPKADFYRAMLDYVMTKEERVAHGHPVAVDCQPGMVRVRGCDQEPSRPTRFSVTFCDDKESSVVRKRCYRCKGDYDASSNGQCSTTDECHYHWGKLRCYNSSRVYTCCKDSSYSTGCTVASQHVSHDKKQGILNGFVKTVQPATIPEDGTHNIVAIDTEMCFTTEGLEVARVTVMSLDGSVLLDAMVRPHHSIVDYNTRFSGLTAADLDGVQTTLEDIQQDILRIVSEDTILVGHGLENDLVGLKVLHEMVVDTAALFPHFSGLPYRRALSDLARTHLGKEIQTSDKGHDSYEDARCCLDLIKWKIQNDRPRTVP